MRIVRKIEWMGKWENESGEKSEEKKREKRDCLMNERNVRMNNGKKWFNMNNRNEWKWYTVTSA